MEFKQFGNVIGFKDQAGPQSPWLGFHAHNLQLAELPSDIWNNPSEISAWSEEVDPETTWANESHFISSLSVNVAQVCNLACTYCAAGGDGTYGSNVKRLDTAKFLPQLRMFLNQLPSGEAMNLHFLGGEPLLFPSLIREIVDCTRSFLAEKNLSNSISFSVTTNGTLINTRTAQLLADIHADVTISLDGDKAVNDVVRPNKGFESSTDMTLRGLAHLQKIRSGLGSLSVNCVFGSHNLAIVSAYNYLHGLNVDWDIYNFNFSNADKSLEVTTAYIEQMGQVARLAAERGGLAELAKIAQFRGPMSRLESKTRLKSYCGAGKSLAQVDTSEGIYPCNWFMGDAEEKLGQGLEMNSPRVSALQASLIDLNNCDSCWARHLCAGGCMAVHKAATGHRHSKDPLFCFRSRSLSALAIQHYYKEITKGDHHEEH